MVHAVMNTSRVKGADTCAWLLVQGGETTTSFNLPSAQALKASSATLSGKHIISQSRLP